MGVVYPLGREKPLPRSLPIGEGGLGHILGGRLGHSRRQIAECGGVGKNADQSLATSHKSTLKLCPINDHPHRDRRLQELRKLQP